MSHFTSSYRLLGYLTLWTLTLISCREADPHDPHLSDYFAGLPVVSLYGNPVEIVETDEGYFTQMWEMTYAEGMLIIRDKDPNHYFKIFHLHSGKIAKLGKIGDGPNELQTDHTRAAVDGANRLVYLSNYPHYYAYRVDSLKNNSNTNPLHRIKINPQEDNLIESTVSGGYVIGAMFTKRFGLHRLEDGHFSSLGEYEQGTFLSNQAAFYAHPFDKKAVMLARSSEAFAILDYTEGHLTMIKDYKGWTSEQREAEEPGGIVRTVPQEDAKYCFVSGATSEKYIYALYSGNLRSATEFIDPALADTVYVFDWKGNPVKKLTLDHSVRSIAVDEENQILYAAAFMDKDLGLIRFDLR